MGMILYHDFIVKREIGGKVSVSHTSEELEYSDPAVIGGARKDTLSLQGITVEPTKASWDFIESVLEELYGHLERGRRFCPPTIKRIEFAKREDESGLSAVLELFIGEVVNDHLEKDYGINHYLGYLFVMNGMTWVIGEVGKTHCDEVVIMDDSHYPIVKTRVKANVINLASITTVSGPNDMEYVRWIDFSEITAHFPLFK